MSDYLPEEVIIKILTKLPVRSLGRCTCVSRRWRAIISEPLFAKSHYKQGPSSRRLIISTYHAPEFYESLNLEDTFEDIRNHASPFKQAEPHSVVMGSINGLVCLSEEYGITRYIWNPTTGMLQELPPPDFRKERCKISFWCGGFGYLSEADDYKVVECTFANDKADHLEVKIFSLRTQVWKMIQSPREIPDMELKNRWGVLLHEALHWIALRGMDIIVLDLATEQFRLMPVPNIVRKEAPYHVIHFCISVCGGCLCYVHWNINIMWDPPEAQYAPHTDLDSIQLWIMSEYGVSHSWTKLYNIRLSNQIQRGFAPHIILVTETSTVLVIITDGENKLVRVEHEVGKPAVIHGFRCNVSLQSVYEESLIWIHECSGAGEKVKRLKIKHDPSGSRNEDT